MNHSNTNMLYDMPSKHLGFPAAQSLDEICPAPIARVPCTLLNVIHIRKRKQ